MTTYYAPIIYDLATHRPLATGEAVLPSNLPLSVQPNNLIQILSDGLYYGTALPLPAYYVNSTGTNTTTSGSKTSPYQTLDYCLAQISANSPNGLFSGQVTVALQAGQTFPVTADFQCAGQIIFTFYGDTNYGDFNSAFVGTPGTDPALMFDLARPIIAPAANILTNGIYGIRLQSNFTKGPVACALSGVQLNLPAGINAAANNTNDFITALNHSSARMSLYGSIVNMLDKNSQAGLLGIYARSQFVTVDQFASQLQVQGAVVNGVTDPQTLLAREFFFKFYPDYAGNNQVAGALSSGSGGSGIMQLNWSTTSQLTVTGSKTNLPTFPLVNLPGTSYGIGQYFTNLNRDQQGRPMNVLCSYLI